MQKSLVLYLRDKLLVSVYKLKGQSLVEILIAIGLISIILPGLYLGFAASRQGKAQQTQRLEAVTKIKEANEAVRSVRERGWSAMQTSGTYYPTIMSNSWNLVACDSPNPPCPANNGFTTRIIVSDVWRNSSQQIVSATTPGASLDLSTKKVEVTVSWGVPYASSVGTSTYYTRFLENNAYTETTKTDFNAGTRTGVTVQGTTASAIPDDGEVILGAGGNGDWCAPQLTTNTLDLPKNGVANAISAIPVTTTGLSGNAFVGTGDNSSGVSFAKVNVNNANPPVSSLQYTFDGYKTNGVFGDTNYAYLATDNNFDEVVIINLNSVVSGKYQRAGHFNAPGNGSGNSIYVVGATGYMTDGNKLYNFDLSNMATCNTSGGCPIKDTDGVTLSGTGNKVFVVGNYAYVATSNSTNQLQVIDISNQTNLIVVGQMTLGNQPAKDLFINSDGTRAYVAMNFSTISGQKEMYIVNTSTKNNPAILGGYDTQGNMNPNGVTVVPGNRAILVGANGEQYQVIDTSLEASPTHCGGVTTGVTINGVSSIVDSVGSAFSYIIVGTDPEFRVIEGGPGGAYSTNGIFESKTFDTGLQTANNRFTANFSTPSSTSIRFQVSMIGAVGGVCPTTSASYTFVDFNGAAGQWSTLTSGQAYTFPFLTTGTYTNPGRCIRYRANLQTSNSSNTPVLNDVTINYSP